MTGAIFVTAITIASLVAIVVVVGWVLQVIANWKIFTKAGEEGWKSLIPVYSNYVSFKIAWKPLYFWVTLLVGVFASIFFDLATVGSTTGNADFVIKSTPLFIIAVIIWVIAVILNIVFYYKLSKAFGYGAGFTLGLLFLHSIFLLILGFNKSEYKGADL